jgi:hypothetical protein
MESTVSKLRSESEFQAIVIHQRDINARRAAEVEGSDSLKIGQLQLKTAGVRVHCGTRFTGAAPGTLGVDRNACPRNANGRTLQADGRIHRRRRCAHARLD